MSPKICESKKTWNGALREVLPTCQPGVIDCNGPLTYVVFAELGLPVTLPNMHVFHCSVARCHEMFGIPVTQ